VANENDPAIKTKPLAHQLAEYDAHKNEEAWALFWVPGLGKTKELLDIASHLFLEGRIKALLVIAPNAVYRNWLTVEIPKHLAVPYVGMAFKSGYSRTDEGKLKQLLFLDPDEYKDKLRVLCMSYDGVRLDRGYEFAHHLVTIYKTMMAVDEMSAIGDGNTLQAKNVKKLSLRAPYRWGADGTPIADGIFRIHSQIEYLYPDFWKNLGMRGFGAFKNQFGEFELDYGKGGKQFKKRVGYRRLDYLQKLIKSVSSRLTKEDAGVELPPKTYTLRTFEMTEEQARIYNEMKHEFMTELQNHFVEAPLAIVRLARLMQITSGFITAEVVLDTEDLDSPPEESNRLDWNPDGDQLTFDELLTDTIKIVKTEKEVIDIMPPEENPRLQLLQYIVEERIPHHKVIVWCRFKRDVDNICKILGPDKCLRYDGSTKQKDRMGILDEFRDPNGRPVLVANTHAISQGVTLVIAKTIIYYSNSHSLRIRLQSEDRAHRIGQEDPIEIIDLAAEGSVDYQVIMNLINKNEISATVLGDTLLEWLKL
jgi:SNF2 family DNA or RNA helicase